MHRKRIAIFGKLPEYITLKFARFYLCKGTIIFVTEHCTSLTDDFDKHLLIDKNLNFGELGLALNYVLNKMIYKYIDRFATIRKFSRGQNDRGGADLA